MSIKSRIQQRIVNSRFIQESPNISAMRESLESLPFKPGHYYSSIVDVQELEERQSEIWPEKQKNILGINLHETAQLELLQKLREFYEDLPFPIVKSEQFRYYLENEYYSYTDGIILYSMIRNFKPNRIIEVGSGYSSALMLDTNELYFANNIDLTFIEPYPKRLKSLLKVEDNVNILEKKVQDINPEFFDILDENDILFIDSSHVSKTGSDLNYLVFEILPRLKKGVKIHFHDIFYPFEYPKDWVLNLNRSWNEDYLIRAFLSFNNRFKIILFPHYLHYIHEKWFMEHMPLCLKNKGGNLWIEAQ